MKREKALETLLVLLIVLLIIDVILGKQYLVWMAIVIGLVGFIFKQTSIKIADFWMGVSEKMGSVVSKIMLSVVYYLFLTPIAFLSRLLDKTTNQKWKKQNVKSYYIERHHHYVANDLKNMW